MLHIINAIVLYGMIGLFLFFLARMGIRFELSTPGQKFEAPLLGSNENGKPCPGIDRRRGDVLKREWLVEVVSEDKRGAVCMINLPNVLFNSLLMS